MLIAPLVRCIKLQFSIKNKKEITPCAFPTFKWNLTGLVLSSQYSAVNSNISNINTGCQTLGMPQFA